MIEGTVWFRRFYKEAKKLSKNIQFRRIKYGFYRIYWVGGCEPAYLGECSKDMPYRGYEWFDIDPRLEDKSYYEEYEDQVELTKKIKNFVEGYTDNIKTLKTRVFMMKNDKEFYNTAVKAYRQVYIK